MPQIEVSKIEKALELLLETLREQQGGVIELSGIDYYWAVNPEDLYHPYATPEHLTLGQLTDDLDVIGRVANGETPPVSLDLVKLGAVLAAIGHNTAW